MKLLETCFSKDIWEQVLLKAYDKTIPKHIVTYYCSPNARVQLLERIVNGDYHIQPPKVVKIPKDNGDFREIYVNNGTDRLFLAVINAALYRLYGDKVSTACKAYMEGSQCGKTAREVAKQRLCGYKLDLSKYFDTVPIEVINNAFSTLGIEGPIGNILYEYYNTHLVIIDGQETFRYKSLAQGCAVAAFLSNYILHDIDDKMLSMCPYYCRYSDDMVLLGDGADDAMPVLKDELSKIGLTLNPAKVEVVSPSREYKFLGFGIDGTKVVLSDKSFKEKKAEVRHAVKTRSTLNGKIRAVQRVFLNFQEPTFSWLFVKSLGVTDLVKVQELDKYCKDTIRASITGSNNYTHNIRAIPNEALREAGYVSLVHLMKVAQTDRDLFKQEVKFID